ncbi:MAG: YihY/virulence factor BrkB family protein [bacterium]
MLKGFFTRLGHWSLLVGVVNLSKRIVLPGFEGLSLNNVGQFFWRGLQEDALNEKAAAVTFNVFLAMFPGILFLFTLISYVPIEDFGIILLLLLERVIPEKTFDAVLVTLEDIVSRQRGGLLSFGFLSALYFSLRGVRSLIHSVNNLMYARETRNALKQVVAALQLVFILAGLTLFAMALIIFNQFVLDNLVKFPLLEKHGIRLLFNVLQWIIIVGIYFLAISFIYFLTPAVKTGFRFISAGSTLATLLSFLVTLGFNFYINNFSKYNILYGSVGTIVIFLLWLYVHSLVLLIGFELNVSIHTAKRNSESKEGT